MRNNGITKCRFCSQHKITFIPRFLLILVLLLLLGKWYDMIYLLTAIGLPPGGSSTIHIYTQTIHRMTQNKKYIEQHKNFGRVRTVPRLGELYPGICLTTEEKTRKPLSQGSRTIRIHRFTIKIHKFCVIFTLVLQYSLEFK